MLLSYSCCQTCHTEIISDLWIFIQNDVKMNSCYSGVRMIQGSIRFPTSQCNCAFSGQVFFSFQSSFATFSGIKSGQIFLNYCQWVSLPSCHFLVKFNLDANVTSNLECGIPVISVVSYRYRKLFSNILFYRDELKGENCIC